MKTTAAAPLLTRREEWRAPAISATLLTFLALTPLLSNRTLRLASQGALVAGMAVHIYKDGKRPFFIANIDLIADCPRLYGTGASKPLDPITDASGEAVGRVPMEKLFMASFREVKSRRTWYGMRRAPLATSSFDLPFTLVSEAITDNQLLFRYGGALVQVVPTEGFKKVFNDLSNRFKLPKQGDIPGDWAYFSSKENDYLLSTDRREWTLAEGWKRCTTNSEGKVVEDPDQTVPEFFRPYLTASPAVSISVRKLGYEPYRNTKKELPLGPERVEILQYRGRFFLLSEKDGQARCQILVLERGVSPEDLRFSGRNVRVFDSRPVKDSEGSSITEDREGWALTNGWQSLKIGEEGHLELASEQALPPYFRKERSCLRSLSNAMHITPTNSITIAVQGLSPEDRPTIQMVRKEGVLHLVATDHMPGYTDQGAPTTIDYPFHHLILLREGATLQNLQFTLKNGQLLIACTN